MADAIQASPRNPLLGGIADLLLKVKGIGSSMESQLGPRVLGQVLEQFLGRSPESVDRLASGFAATEPPQITGPDPSLYDKYPLPAALSAAVPGPGTVGKAFGIAKGMSMAPLPLTMLDRSHLLQLAKTEPEMVRKLEEARRASLYVKDKGGSPEASWRAGSRYLEGTPYAGWLPAHGVHPDMFEVTDVGARLHPRFDPHSMAQFPGLGSIPAKATVEVGKLGENFRHPELEKFLPDMPQWEAQMVLGPGQSAGGSGLFDYTPQRQRAGMPPIIEAEATNPSTLRSVLLHEGQHGAQAFSGKMPEGSNPKYELARMMNDYAMDPANSPFPTTEAAKVNYLNSPGEMVARATETRRFLPAEDLRKRPFSIDLAAQEFVPPAPVAPTPLTIPLPPPSGASGLSELARLLLSRTPLP